MSNIGVAAFFKGDSATEKIASHQRLLEEHAINASPVIHTPGKFSQDTRFTTYVSLLGAAKKRSPQLVENVGRVCAAQMHRVLLGERSTTPLMFVEGCEWDWGYEKRTGANIMRLIYDGVIPPALKRGHDDPVVEPYSARTLEEWHKIREIALQYDVDEIHGVTGGYHAQRTAFISQEVFQSTVITPKVFSTGEIAERISQLKHRDPEDRFMADVIRRSEPSKERLKEEEAMEKKLMLLAKIRKKTGFDPEGWILRWKTGRKRAKPQS